MRIKFLLILFLCFLAGFLLGQPGSDPRIDSLKKALGEARNDTTRCSILNQMIEAETDDNIWPAYNEQLKTICEENLKKYKKGELLYNFYLRHLAAAISNEAYLANNRGDITKALEYFQKGYALEKETGNKHGMAASLDNLGSVYQYQGNIKKALEHYRNSEALYREVGDKRGMAESITNQGLIYNDQGDLSSALDYYHKSLDIQESIGDKKGMAITYNNIGALYGQQNDLVRALNYYQKSLKLEEELKERQLVTGSLHNIGIIYKKQGNMQKALDYLNKAYDLSKEMESPVGMAHCLNSIGTVYSAQGNDAKALDYWNKSMSLWEKLDDKQGQALTGNHIARALLLMGKMAEAQKAAEHSLANARELGFPDNIKDASQTLSTIYSKTGKWKQAFDMEVLCKQMSDSIAQQSSRKSFIQKTFQYEYEKKVAADSIRTAGERRLFDAEIRQQKTQRTALYCGITLITLFALFMYNRFRTTQRQKQIIEVKEKETQQQKQIIEEKHKEISDSINYAERIQRSFLATEELLDKNLGDYFILFQPKAIVSGDFYWGSELSNGSFAFITADSTGHGVPGAIMSLLNITSLEKAVEHSTDPAQILNYTRKTIIDRLKKDGSAEGGKDGMDCSLMVFDPERKHVQVSTAHNPVLIVRKNKDRGSKELIELGSDKMPVGKHERDTESFSKKEISLEKGDMVYAVTDGFADQFGGPNGKKFMHKRLKELLLSISDEPVQKQKEVLSNMLSNWIGQLEQVDDITVAGIRIS